MAISSLHVAGYRSVRDVRLERNSVNVLVGPNGCGKTNLYRALYLLAAAAGGADHPRGTRDDGGGGVRRGLGQTRRPARPETELS